jgi:16S rRNA processing protein RimM
MFAGVGDRDEAERLRGTLLLIDTDADTLAAGDDEYWDHELIGAAVVDSDGSRLGVVGDVIHLPAQDLLSVIAEDGHEVLVPFVAEIVTDVDVTSARVVVRDPGGLFDESEAVSAGDARGDADAGPRGRGGN